VKTTSRTLGTAAAVCLGCALQAADASDEDIIRQWKGMVLRHSNFTKYTDGEDMAWRVSPYLRGTMAMAEALDGDRECLDTFSRAFEHLMSIASRDIDGLFGWPTRKGSYGRHGKRCIIMDDALICETVGVFYRLVKGNPKLKKTYGARAEKYMKFVEEKIFPKWKESWLELKDKAVTLVYEGTSRRRGEVKLPEPAGVYRYYEPGKRPGKSLPLNQFWHVAKCYLALYDATGKKDYLDKIAKMARTGKYIYLEETANRVRPWFYWRPVYAGDFKSRNEPLGWSGPHPKRSSYAGFEVAMMARFHQRRIVFTDDDMRRVVRLQLDHQWNKSLGSPKFQYLYKRRRGYNKPYPSKLWSSLAYFDPTIAKMSARYGSREYIASVAGKWRGIGAVPKYFLNRKKAAKGK